jgi:hypothetical protein
LLLLLLEQPGKTRKTTTTRYTPPLAPFVHHPRRRYRRHGLAAQLLARHAPPSPSGSVLLSPFNRAVLPCLSVACWLEIKIFFLLLFFFIVEITTFNLFH